jgi:hypothetical protein
LSASGCVEPSKELQALKGKDVPVLKTGYYAMKAYGGVDI